LTQRTEWLALLPGTCVSVILAEIRGNKSVNIPADNVVSSRCL